MPDVRLPNGTIIKNVPAGTTKAQLESKLRRNGYGDDYFRTATVDEPKQEKEEEPGVLDTIQSYTLDQPVRLLRGAVTGIRGVSDVFGADNIVSQGLRSVEEGISENLLSDTAAINERERAKTLEGKGFFGTLGEIPGLVADDPGLVTEVVGTALPAILAGIATGGTATVATVGAQLGVGAAMGAGFVKGSIYDATKQELIGAGVSEADAEKAAVEAQAYAGENLDMIALGAGLGAVASRTGLEPAVAKQVAGCKPQCGRSRQRQDT
jgi:hypothetical protein